VAASGTKFRHRPLTQRITKEIYEIWHRPRGDRLWAASR